MKTVVTPFPYFLFFYFFFFSLFVSEVVVNALFLCKSKISWDFIFLQYEGSWCAGNPGIIK